MTEEPDAGHMARFCREFLPEMLVKACDVAVPDATRVAQDILLQAETAACLGVIVVKFSLLRSLRSPSPMSPARRPRG